MTKETNCPKCGGHMHPGKMLQYVAFVPDNVPINFLGAGRSLPIIPAYACTKCGFVEMYVAPDELRKKLREANLDALYQETGDISDPKTLSLRSEFLREQGRYDELLECDRRRIALDPGDETAWWSLGSTLYFLEQYTDALDSLDRAIEINPNIDMVWYSRAHVLKAQGDLENSSESFAKAIGLNPEDADFWFERGRVLSDLSRFDEALVDFDKTIEIDPDYYEAWRSRGDVLSSLGREAEALESHQRAIEFEDNGSLGGH